MNLDSASIDLPATSEHGRLRELAARARTVLPRGQTLPEEVWERRHRWLLGFLWVQVVALTAIGFAKGFAPLHALADGGALIGFAVLGTTVGGRRFRAAMVSLGLMTAAAVVVHLFGGYIEAHFYFFVMIVVLTLYEDWLVFLLALGYVVLHHGVIGTLYPAQVYNHPDAIAHPWQWAAIHGAFVAAAGVGAVVAWRLNEDARAATAEALDKAKAAQHEAEQSLSLLEATLESTADGILVVDGEGVIVSFNDEFVRMWRIPPEVTSSGDDEKAIAFVLDQLERPDAFVAKVRELYSEPDAESYDVLEFKDGRVFERYSQPQRVGGESVGRVWSFRDVTERRRFETELQHLADHDAVTNLFNRRRFEEELNREAARASRYEESGAVLVLDLDNFKSVNDTLGHQAGDEVIRSVARMVSERLRETDIVARLGGDEFAVILPHTPAPDAHAVGTDLLETLRKRGAVAAGRSLPVTMSVGVALFGSIDASAEELLAAADLAMYEAKESGRDRMIVFTPRRGDEARAKARSSWIERIRAALEHERFVLHAQPILDLKENEVSQYELLIRMMGDAGELVLPTSFLGAAERFGLIQSIDRWVVRQAIHLMDRQLELGRELRLEVNISGKSVDDPELPKLIQRELAQSSVDPDNLILEITETALISNMEQATRFAETLTRVGCRFALDDFGTGFGSYYYLKRLPLHYLKIDGDFIRSLSGNLTDQLMVKAMVQVAQGLGMLTIAEFVGGDETIDFLKEYGVDFAQGFHVGRPQPISEVWPAVEPAAASPV